MAEKTKTDKTTAKLSEDQLKELAIHNRFTLKEVKLMHEEFFKKYPTGKLDKKTYLGGDFTEKHKEKFCQMLFDHYDTNKDGFVDFKELFQIASVTQRGTHEEKMRYLFDFYDLNKDGYISEEEVRFRNFSVCAPPPPPPVRYASPVTENVPLHSKSGSILFPQCFLRPQLQIICCYIARYYVKKARAPIYRIDT